MPYIGNNPTDVPLTGSDLADNIITSAKIVDGTIVNADINASAGIVGTKLSALTGNVAFPATQVPSVDANTLDDYEEGTWTPVLKYGGANVGMTMTTGVGRYTKIGDLVSFEWWFTVGASAGSSTGAASIEGLPFTSSSAPTGMIAIHPFGMANGDSVSGGLIGQIVLSSSIITLYQTVTGDNALVDETMADASATLYGAGQYWVNNV